MQSSATYDQALCLMWQALGRSTLPVAVQDVNVLPVACASLVPCGSRMMSHHSIL